MRQVLSKTLMLQFFVLLMALSNVALALYPLPPLTYQAWTIPKVELPVPRKTYIPPKKLTLRDAILLALRSNPNVRNAELQRVSDKFALEVARNQFEPQYGFTANATFGSNQTPNYSITPTVSLQTATGATITSTYNNTFTGSGGYSTTLSVSQPLLKGFGPKVALAPLVQAYFTEYTNRLALKNQILSTITQVIQSYYALVQSYNELVVQEITLEAALTTLQQLQTKVKAGQAAPADLVEQQSQVANSQLAVTQARNTIQQNYLALLSVLGLDPNSKLDIDKNIIIGKLVTPSLDKSTNLALSYDVTYQQALYSLKNAEVALILAKDAQKWTLNAVATKVVGNGPSGISGVSSGGNDTIALNLNIPINNMKTEQQLVNAKVTMDQQRISLADAKRQLRITIITTIQSLAYQQKQIEQAENAVVLAQQAVDVAQKKLDYGRTTVFEVVQLRDNLTQAKLNLIGQQISYINALALFEQTIGISLDKWNIQICY